MQGIVRDYVQSCQAATQEPDMRLLLPIVEVLRKTEGGAKE
jgi:hypothetical protein